MSMENQHQTPNVDFFFPLVRPFVYAFGGYRLKCFAVRSAL